MRLKVYSLLIAFLFVAFAAGAQSYPNSGPKVFHGGQQTTTDTINVTGLSPQNINGTFGLDSVSFSIRYDYDMDLVLTLISPDGKQVRIAENLSWGDSNYTNTVITMSVNTLINDVGAPFTGLMRPEGWLGAVNDGQNGNGKWVFKILNTTNSNDSGVLLNWSLHFSNTPAPPAFFDSSKLPIVVVKTANDMPIPFYSDTKVNGTMGVIYNGVNATNHLNDPYNNYNGNITIKVRGNSTRYFAQKPYNFSTADAAFNDSNVTLLGMPSENDWILYAPFDDKSLIRNVITYQLSNDMGDYAVRTRMCELVLNGDYRGVYVMEEKIKRDSARVNINKLKPQDTTGNAVTGGYIFEVDRAGNPGYDSWYSNYFSCNTSTSPIALAYVYPKPADINGPQKQYIANYLDSFEYALTNLPLNDTVHGYRHFIDVPSFIDFMLQQELGHNVDGYRLSSFCYKKKNGKLFGGPIWDFNEAYGNANYYLGYEYNSYEWDFPCPFSDPYLNPFWWKKFTTDTAYMDELRCRYTNLRYQGAFDTAHMYHLIDSLVNLLQVPQTRHYKRWPIMGVYIWPNAYVSTSYDDEITTLKKWLNKRTNWLDGWWYNPACLDTAVVIPTGLAQVNKPNDIKLYPNPASDVLTIASRIPVDNVVIYNIMGQQVYSQKSGSSLFNISLKQSGLSNGVYTMVLSTQNGTVRRNFVLDN